MHAAESRELLSAGISLSPATEPVELRLSLLSETPMSGTPRRLSAEDVVHVPVTLAGSPPGSIELSPLMRREQATDLIFARVTVSASGERRKVELLNASPAIENASQWITNALKIHFYPSSLGFVDSTDGTCLILLRALRDVGQTDPATILPRDSPWVKAFVREFRGTEVPPITDLILVASSVVIPFGPDVTPGDIERRRNMKSNSFDFNFAGSDWSANLLKFVQRRGVARWFEVRAWKTNDEMVQ